MNKLKILIKNNSFIHSLYKYFVYYRKQKRQYQDVLNKISNTNEIRVAFYLFNTDTWKADSVYKAFEDSDRFIPYIIICPMINKSNSFFENQYKQCIDLVTKNNYRHLIGFNGDHINGIEKANLPNFDIVFYQNPNDFSINAFNVLYNTNSLNCYIPYSFNIDNLIDYDFNKFNLNMMFKVFTLSPYHQGLYIKHSDVKGDNCYNSGFPQLDSFFSKSTSNPWKNTNTIRKKIIWGPHWTIPGKQDTGLDWSNFLDYAYIMLDIADKYVDEIELALKPHPFLFQLLEKQQNWGHQKTKDYIRSWNERENCQIHLGDYVDLFKHSDALIHDSGSFAVEYLCMDKPVAYTSNTNDFINRFNEIGQRAIKAHHIINNKNELKNFVIKVVQGDDDYQKSRNDFRVNTLRADGNAGKRIVKHLENILK